MATLSAGLSLRKNGSLVLDVGDKGPNVVIPLVRIGSRRAEKFHGAILCS
jgi:hypothetical protein